jgi:hypothetical protein
MPVMRAKPFAPRQLTMPRPRASKAIYADQTAAARVAPFRQRQNARHPTGNLPDML